jgi:hypothetical protein
MTLSITLPTNNVDIKDFFSNMIKLVYNSYQITHVNYDQKNYFNCSNSWSGGKPSDGRYCHDDEECDGYSDCELERTTISNKNKNNVKYFYIRDINYDCDNDNDNELYQEVKNIMDYLEENDDDNIVFNSNYEIVLINPYGINDDHRGSDHTPIVLPFHQNVILGKTFTLDDLINACYKIKSHKFDYWYELYCGVDKVYTKDDNLFISVAFDHGS